MVRAVVQRWLKPAICCLVLAVSGAGEGIAHEVGLSAADVNVGRDRIDLTITLRAEPMISGMSLDRISDSGASPLAGEHDALRAVSARALEAAVSAAWPDLAEKVVIMAGAARLAPELVSVTTAEVPDPSKSRDTVVVLTARLPADGSPVTFGWDAAFGPIAVVQTGPGGAYYSAILQGGERTAEMQREGASAAADTTNAAPESVWAVLARFVVSGLEHIIPKGLDHILFVMGLFLFSPRIGPLLGQVTAFTLAHTVTLALATLQVVSIPASIVEPLIAASIVYVAIENIVGGRIGVARVAVVFAFGLLHGLGFASVLGDVGLSQGQFLPGLIGFNLGVEFGQLAVILVAFLLLGLPFGRQPWYRSRIVVPLSVAIAAVGGWWTMERVFL